MAERGVFFAKKEYPYFEEVYVQFPWFGGFAKAQKQRNTLSLAMNFEAAYPERRLLEVSSRSLFKLGNDLSAMSLSKRMSDGRIVVMESAFQSSRIYRDDSGMQIGPFPELVELPGRECKKAVKEASLGLHSYEYCFDGCNFPAPDFHISLFYDYLYLNALMEPENAATAALLRESGYDTFSDLASKSLNSQARSCAIYIGLWRSGLLDRVTNYDEYLRLFRVDLSKADYAAEDAYENVQLLTDSGCVSRLRPVVVQTVSAEQVKDAYIKLVDNR